MILVEGSFTPGFSDLIWGASQVLIFPSQMSERIGPVRCRPLGTPVTWYATAVAESAHGTSEQPLQAENWLDVMGASLAPKSTVRAVICSMPPPDPIAPYVTVTPLSSAYLDCH